MATTNNSEIKSPEERLKRFIDSHADLIEQYENMGDDMTPIDCMLEDIINSYEKLKKVSPRADIIESFRRAISNSITYNISILDSYDGLIGGQLANGETSNSIQRYFKEINDIYTKNDNNYDIQYCPENRDKLIEMNLKTVISIAKSYQGLGLSLEELISAGNLGLVIAFDKFDPTRSKLKDDILDAIDKGLGDEFEYSELSACMQPYLAYGDVKSKFNLRFRPKNTYTKKDLIKWVNSNIHNAKFNSVASMWIKAYILIEIDNYSRLVKKPKTEIIKDKEVSGSYKKEVTVNIDAPVGADGDTPLSEILYMEDDTRSDLDTRESYDTFKDGLNKLLEGVKSRDRRIFLRKFGIGLPRPMLPREIANQEGLSIARVSQIFQNVVEQMQKNQAKYNIDSETLFDAVKNLY